MLSLLVETEALTKNRTAKYVGSGKQWGDLVQDANLGFKLLKYLPHSLRKILQIATSSESRKSAVI